MAVGRLTASPPGAGTPEGASPLLLCVHGSPRRGGNTDLLLGALAEGAVGAGARVDHIHCPDLEIRGCTGCGACSETGVCVIRDAMDGVYALADEAAAIALAAPVYFLGVPARLKALIDRFQCRWARRYVLGVPPPRLRPGAFVSVAGAPVQSVFTCPQKTVEAWFDVLGVECSSNLLYADVDERAAIRTHPRALDEARHAGAALAQRAARSRDP